MTFQSTAVIVAIVLLLLGVALVGAIRNEEHNQSTRQNAYRQGFGEEYDLELNRLSEIERLKPQGAPSSVDLPDRAFVTAKLQYQLHKKRSKEQGTLGS